MYQTQEHREFLNELREIKRLLEEQIRIDSARGFPEKIWSEQIEKTEKRTADTVMQFKNSVEKFIEATDKQANIQNKQNNWMLFFSIIATIAALFSSYFAYLTYFAYLKCGK